MIEIVLSLCHVQNPIITEHVRTCSYFKGTHRSLDGSLKATAGRVSQLDEFIQKSKDIDSDFVTSFTDFISTLDAAHAEASALYLSTAAKIHSKGASYTEQEINRLQSMITSASVAPASKTAFQLRQNILKAFLNKNEQE